jgi:hypothetical protein
MHMSLHSHGSTELFDILCLSVWLKTEVLVRGGQAGLTQSVSAVAGANNLGSVMASSNGTLDSIRALGSISSGGVVPAAVQLAQRGALGAYPAAMLQTQYLPWLLRVQARLPRPQNTSHGCLLGLLPHTVTCAMQRSTDFHVIGGHESDRARVCRTQGAQQALPQLFPGAQVQEGGDAAQMASPMAGLHQGDPMINTNSLSSKSPDRAFPTQSKKVGPHPESRCSSLQQCSHRAEVWHLRVWPVSDSHCGVRLVQRKSASGRTMSGDPRSMDISQKFSMSHSDDDDEHTRGAGDDGDDDEGESSPCTRERALITVLEDFALRRGFC